MKNDEIENIIYKDFPTADLLIEGADCSFTVTIVHEGFADMPRLQRQQAIYELFSEQLKSGVLHALSIKALTPEEWNNRSTKGLVSISL